MIDQSEARLNLPFTGIATFAKVPYHEDLSTLEADVAIFGAPYDLGTQVRSGARFGPRGIRAASTIYGMRTVTYYDAEFDEIYLDGVRIVDVGDADMIHSNPDACLSSIEAVAGKIIERGALPVALGGDHAVTIPLVRAQADNGPMCVVQIDAHLDFVDERFGVREGHGNVMRRVAEMDHVSGIAQIGIRGPGSSDPSDFADARAMGSHIIGPRELRRVGIDAVLERIPEASNYYVTIDCDGFDAALMPGTGSPSPGGLNYHEVVDLLRGVAAKGRVVGLDFVEVAPVYDQTEVTGQTAARVILDFLGAIFKARAEQEPLVGADSHASLT
jgi:agmatinase